MTQEHINKVSDEDILIAYDEKKTLHETAVNLGLTTVTLWRRAKKLGIKWSEIKRKGVKKIELQDILEGKHPEYQTFKLKLRLINENIKENKCEICEITEWQGNPIAMQLDHIDGNSHNHLLNNLRIICPNCHSQTETYCGKNKQWTASPLLPTKTEAEVRVTSTFYWKKQTNALPNILSYIARWCNGNTTVFGAVFPGSNPGRATNFGL